MAPRTKTPPTPPAPSGEPAPAAGEAVPTLAPAPLSARVRLERSGAGALSDADLLRALLGDGTYLNGAGLVERDGLRALLGLGLDGLAPIMGRTRAVQLLAALELGRRALRAEDKRPRLRTPAEIDTYLRPQLAHLGREVFHVLCFNARNVLVADVRVAEGTVNACPVDPREVFRAALGAQATATALVLVHNHPSGDPEPSSMDVALTAQLVEGGCILGLRVLDHLVIGADGYVSMLERGMMPAGTGEGRGRWS